VKGRGYEEEQGGPIFEHPLIHQILGKSKERETGTHRWNDRDSLCRQEMDNGEAEEDSSNSNDSVCSRGMETVICSFREPDNQKGTSSHDQCPGRQLMGIIFSTASLQSDKIESLFELLESEFSSWIELEREEKAGECDSTCGEIDV
jgi:hypothetical protein